MKKLISSMVAAGMLLTTSSSAFAYTVKPGDTMYHIAVENNMTLSQLAALNPQVKDLNLIFVDQNINTDSSVAKPIVAAASTDYVAKVSISAEEKDLLARLVRAEACGESFEGKVAVANVVLNRVNSGKFPNTIEGVIYQAGQFSPVDNGEINKPADNDSVSAVDEALSGVNEVPGALYFYNPATATETSWLNTLPTVTQIGNHIFKS